MLVLVLVVQGGRLVGRCGRRAKGFLFEDEKVLRIETGRGGFYSFEETVKTTEAET